jgi:hypothetical protein
MRGEHWLLRMGEFLVGRAARHLPAAARAERYQEWAAELPVILGDPEIKPAVARAARMVWFAADTLRGAALGPGLARRRGAHRGRGTPGKDARWLGVGLALLTGLAVLLAGLAFIVYYDIFIASASLAGYVSVLLSFSLAILVGCLLWRHPGRARPGVVRRGHAGGRCGRWSGTPGRSPRLGPSAAVHAHQRLRLRGLRRLHQCGRGHREQVPPPGPAGWHAGAIRPRAVTRVSPAS